VHNPDGVSGRHATVRVVNRAASSRVSRSDTPTGSHATSVFAEFCASGLWPGVGPAVAAQLAEAGIDHPAKVTEAGLADLPGVTDKRARRLYSAWIAAAPLYDLAMLLVPHGFPARWAWRLADALGDDAAAALAADPWQLLALPDASIPDADRLARSIQPDVRADDPRRTRALVDWALGREARSGHTACPIPTIAEALRLYGVADGADAAAAMGAAVDAAVDAGLARRVGDPAGSAEPWVARRTLADAEDAIARHLRRLVASARPLASAASPGGAGASDTSGAQGDVRGDNGLDAVQRGAVAAAWEHGVSVLTGGPGTGKSRTVTSVVRRCRRAGVTVALAAPTGRAAKRLAELLSEAGIAAASGDQSGDQQEDGAGDSVSAMTIHRLLGARPAAGGRGSTFEYDADNRLDADMLVVDEASMVDVELAAALLGAIPDGAHLLIVGDPAQLPSIGAGRVLGDVLESGMFPTTELSTLYRQAEGGAIARLATAVREGDLVAPDSADREVVIVPADGSAAARTRVVQLVTDSIPRVFDLPADQIQVITPIHAGAAGTKALNQALKAVLNPGSRSGGTVRGFDVGDRVVATANHFEAEPNGYANGEVGTVVDAAGKSLLVAFPSGEAEISGKALGDLLHGWAITVHRAQGSEWPAVVVVLPPDAGRMLSRPLVYTALTRARRHLSVVHAAGPLLARAVRYSGATPRRTRLVSLLAAGDARGRRTGAPGTVIGQTDRI
jgi:exodeoxyribonuclease V alpha subunit